eukprot:scaffold1073_cov383-Prasinococcus_capsulatus_cf.AAC.15
MFMCMTVTGLKLPQLTSTTCGACRASVRVPSPPPAPPLVLQTIWHFNLDVSRGTVAPRDSELYATKVRTHNGKGVLPDWYCEGSSAADWHSAGRTPCTRKTCAVDVARDAAESSSGVGGGGGAAVSMAASDGCSAGARGTGPAGAAAIALASKLAAHRAATAAPAPSCRARRCLGMEVPWVPLLRNAPPARPNTPRRSAVMERRPDAAILCCSQGRLCCSGRGPLVPETGS